MTGNEVKALLIAAFSEPPESQIAQDAMIEIIAGLFDILNDIQFHLQNLDERTRP